MSISRRRRPLTPAEWAALAAKQHEIERLMAESDAILSEALTVAQMSPYWKAFGRVQSLRSRLEDLAFEQGQDGMALFHGPAWVYHAGWR